MSWRCSSYSAANRCTEWSVASTSRHTAQIVKMAPSARISRYVEWCPHSGRGCTLVADIFVLVDVHAGQLLHGVDVGLEEHCERGDERDRRRDPVQRPLAPEVQADQGVQEDQQRPEQRDQPF